MPWEIIEEESSPKSTSGWEIVQPQPDRTPPEKRGFFSQLDKPDPTTWYGDVLPIGREEGEKDASWGYPSRMMQDSWNFMKGPDQARKGELTFEQMDEKARGMATMVGTGTLAKGLYPGAARVVGRAGESAGRLGAEALDSPVVGQMVQGVSNASSTVAGWTGIPKAIKNHVDRLPENVDRVAAERIAERMYQDGLTVDDIGRTLQGLGKPGVVADAGGRNMWNQTKFLMHGPGKTAQIADEVLNPRNAQQASRMVNSTKKNISGKSFYNEMDRLTAQQAKGASPLYRRAYADFQNLSTPWLRNAMEQDPLIMQGLKRGEASLRREATILGDKYNPRDYGVVDFNAAGDPILGTETPLSMWHAARRGIDDILEEMRDPVTTKLPNSADQLIRLRKALDVELKQATGGVGGAFTKADAIYSGPAKIKDAMRQGRKFATGDGELTEKLFKGMSVGEKEAYRIGVSRELIKQIRKSRTTPTILRDVLHDTEVSDKIKLFAPTPREYQSFIKTLENEARMTMTSSLRAGSHTGALKAEADDIGSGLGGLAGMVIAGATGNPSGVALPVIQKAINWMSKSGLSQDVLDRMGQMLLSQDPAEQRMLLDMIRKMETPPTQTIGKPPISGGSIPQQGLKASQ